MADLPRVENTQPVLNPQRVNSTAASSDEFAKFLGGVSSASSEVATKIVGDQSKAMYIHSVANIDQAKNDAQKALTTNPDQAERINKNMVEITDQVVQNSYVNKEDRLNLSKYAKDSANAVSLDATRVGVDQSRRVAQYAHWESWPGQLTAYKDALISGDQSKIKNLGDAMHDTLQGLVETRVLTPIEAGHGLNDMHLMGALASDHLSLYGNPDATAQHYHTVNSHPLAKSGVMEEAPLEGNTQWLIHYHNQDKSYQGAQNDVDNHMRPDPQVFDSLSPANRQNLIFRMHGVQIADGMTNSGMPFPQIESHINELNKSKNLSPTETAAKNALNSWIGKLQSGRYQEVVAATPEGNRMINHFMSSNAAIESAMVYTPEGRQKAFIKTQNDFVNSMVSWGEAHHIPRQYIQPISKLDTDSVQSAFVLHGDPNSALQTIGKYTKQNQAYLSNAMKNPAQRMMVQALSYSGDSLSLTQKKDFIFANQQGIDDEKTKKIGGFEDITAEKGFKDKLNGLVADKLNDQVKLLRDQYQFEDGRLLQEGMIESTANYAKYIGQKHGDLSMSNIDRWVDEAAKVYQHSHPVRSNTNYIVNDKGLPEPLTDHQLDVLAFYATEQGANYVKDGRHPAVYESASGRNTLKMIMTSTNDLQAVDENGNTYFSRGWDSNTYTTAEDYYNKQFKSFMKPGVSVYGLLRSEEGNEEYKSQVPSLALRKMMLGTPKEQQPKASIVEAKQPENKSVKEVPSEPLTENNEEIERLAKQKIRNAKIAVKRRSPAMSGAISGEK